MFNFFKVSKLFLFAVPLAVALVTPSTLFPFIVGKYVWFRVAVDLALLAFLLGLLFHESAMEMNKKVALLFHKPLFIAVTVFIVVFLLACFFGVDPKMSFWSNFERGEGGFQLLHLWFFFTLLILLFREERDWRAIFYTSITGGLLMAFYGFLAGIGAKGVIGPSFQDASYRLQGSIGNSAYVAMYSIFILFYVAFLFFIRKRNFRSITTAGLISLGIIFFAAFYFAATRGAFVGFIIAACVFLAYIAYSRKRLRKWLFVCGVFSLVVIGCLVAFRNSTFVKSIPGSRNFDISFSSITFEHRAIMWKVAVDGFKERPLLGWGPENYLQVFDRHFNTKYFVPLQGFGAWFDRAHSIYFDYLVETGILGLLSFLSMFVVFYWCFFSQSRKLHRDISLEKDTVELSPFMRKPLAVRALVFALPFAYLIQGIVLFDILMIYLNTFLFFAFATYLFSTPPSQKHQ